MRYAFCVSLLVALICCYADAGINKWTSANGPNGGAYTSFVFPRSAPDIVFASGDDIEDSGVFRSRNGGISWETTGFPDPAYSGLPLAGILRIDPQQPTRLVIINGRFLLESTDLGNSWH